MNVGFGMQGFDLVESAALLIGGENFGQDSHDQISGGKGEMAGDGADKTEHPP